MSGFPPLRLGRRSVGQRVLILLRLDPSLAACSLPPGVAPLVMSERALVSLCWTRLAPPRLRLLPRQLAGGTDHLATRLAVEAAGPEAPHPGTYVLRRETSSRFGARFGEKAGGCEVHHASFDVEAHRFGLRLDVRADEDELLHLRAEHAPAPRRDSLFRSARAAAEFLIATSDVRPADPFAPEADHIGPTTTDFALEPLELLELRAGLLDGSELFPADALELDSAWRVVDTRADRAPVRATVRIQQREVSSSPLPAL
jgi:hypothetical protein